MRTVEGTSQWPDRLCALRVVQIAHLCIRMNAYPGYVLANSNKDIDITIRSKRIVEHRSEKEELADVIAATKIFDFFLRTFLSRSFPFSSLFLANAWRDKNPGKSRTLPATALFPDDFFPAGHLAEQLQNYIIYPIPFAQLAWKKQTF